MDTLTFVFLLTIGVIALVIYIGTIGLFAPPAWSVYGFVLVTFLFPNWATEYVGIGGVVPLYFFVELGCCLSVLLAARRAVPGPMDAGERRVLHVFLFMLVFHTLTYWPLRFSGFYPQTESELAVTIQYAVKAFCPAVFLYGIARTIRTREQLTPLCWIFLFCGVELLLEWFLIVNRQLVPGLVQYVVDDHGQFKSFTEMEPLSVGQFAMMASLSAAYLAHQRRSVLLGLASIPLMIPGLILYQRTILVAIPLSIIVFWWLSSNLRWRVGIGVAAVLTIAVAYAVSFDVEAATRTLFEGTWRDTGVDAITLDAFRTDQILARNGIQARALDVFVYFFPFGTGEFDLRWFLSSEEIPSHFMPSDPIAAQEYVTTMRGLHATETHNMFLEHAVSYGFLGIVAMTMFIIAVLNNARGMPSEIDARRLYALAYAGLFFFAAFANAYASPKGYPILLTLFHSTFIVRAAVMARTKPVVTNLPLAATA